MHYASYIAFIAKMRVEDTQSKKMHISASTFLKLTTQKILTYR